MQLDFLKIGDTVEVVAPASGCSRLELRQGLQLIRSWGLIPRVSPKILNRSLLFSNSDHERVKQLKRAVQATDAKLIWCLRGGYGAIRLMPEVVTWKRPGSAKIFLGYSDMTTLHVHLNQKWKWPSLHGPLLDRVGRGGLTASQLKELKQVLFGVKSNVEFIGLRPLNGAAQRPKKIQGSVLGGNLTTLQSGLGTPSGLRPSRGFLFFEDRGERPHRVDRMLTQMLQAGWFERCQAVLLGDFELSSARDRRGLWQDVFPRFAKQLNIPVLAGLRVGHADGGQRILPLNTRATLTLGHLGKLQVSTGICPA